MPTYSSPILPNVAGLAFGSAAQPWSIFATTGSFQRIVSLTTNPSTAAFFSLANTDLISWRNAANAANLNLSPSGVAAVPFDADLLTYTGSGFKGSEFVSPNNPARSGVLRLGATDAIVWRNQANTADISISKNADDSIGIPTSLSTALVQPTGTTGTALTVEGGSGGAAGGQLNLVAPNGTAAGGMVILSSGAAGANNGASIAMGGGVLSTNTGGSVTIQSGTGAVTNGVINLNCPGGLQITNVIKQYGGIALVGNGVGSQVATVDLLNQIALVGNTTLYTTTFTGQYRFTWNAKVTTVAGTSSTLGALTITYVDPDSVLQTITCGAQTSAGAIATTSAGNSTATVLLGLPMMLNCKTATAITYGFAYASNAAATMAYNLHVRIEAM